MMQHSKDLPQNGGRWSQNRHHWENNLDSQNLDRPVEPNLDLDLRLYETADFMRALEDLGNLREALLIDFGGGLGLSAIHFARRGATVVIADLSGPRLRRARELVRQAGHEESVHFVQCSGDQLPFVAGAFQRSFCKSVLIHTRLTETAAELERTLSPDGIAVYIEPLDSNPFANLYRRLLAPKEWQGITDYFSPAMIATLRRPFEARGTRERRLFFFAFFATPFNYMLKWPGAYRLTETLLGAIDSVLLAALPVLRRWCWFVVLRFGKG